MILIEQDAKPLLMERLDECLKVHADMLDAQNIGSIYELQGLSELHYYLKVATVYKGNIIKNLIMDCQSYTKYRPNETTGGIFVSWRRKEELPTGA